MRNKSDHLPLLVVAALWLTSFTISSNLLIDSLAHDNRRMEPSFAKFIFGASRKVMAAHFYENAELYFHRGTGHFRPRAFENTFFQQLAEDIRPSVHSHRSGRDVREIIPWLWMSIRMDPSNVETYLAASFWLARECDRFDLAHNVLAEARWANPFNYQTAMEDAFLHLREGNREAALKLLEAGLAFWPGNDRPDSETAKHDKARMLLYRALMFESEGAREKAVEDLREILDMFPARKELQNRIEELCSEKASSRLASGILDDMLEKDEKIRSSSMCHMEKEDGAADRH